MELNENQTHARSKEWGHLSLENVDSAISYMKRLVEELSSAINILPKVDEEGYSDCPFAEDLYAQKDEAAEKVEAELPKLQRYVGIVERDIARCQANLDRIEADAGRLNREEAKGSYASAGRSQGYQYENAIRQREALGSVISMAEKVLALARSKAFPGRKPQKAFGPLSGTFEGRGATGSPYGPSVAPPGRPSVQDEIDSLVSSGPLDRKES